MNDEHLPMVVGGGDVAAQPLTMPPGWMPGHPDLPGWINSVTDYLKYLGACLAA